MFNSKDSSILTDPWSLIVDWLKPRSRLAAHVFMCLVSGVSAMPYMVIMPSYQP